MVRPLRHDQTERAIALLLVVSLLTLVTLLVVSLAAITRVETQLGAHVVDEAQARQNARFALDVATGELQRLAGPDDRATTSAAALVGATAAMNNNPHWTAVWASADHKLDPLGWLVSGSEPGYGLGVVQVPTVSLNRESQPDTRDVATLLRDDESGGSFAVAVPKADLPATGMGRNPGRCAWWISDESLKLGVGLGDQAIDLTTPDYLRDDEAQVSRQASPLQLDVTRAVSGAGTAWPAVAAAPNPTAFVLSDPALGSAAAWLRLSAVSRAVLASSLPGARGGLRQDLSIDPTLVAPGLDRWLDYPAYMARPGALTQSRIYTIRAGTDRSAGDVIDHVAPVLTDLAVGVFVFAPSSRNQNLTVRLQFFAELWNPYASELAMTPLRLRLSGLPRVTISCSNGDRVTIDLDALLGGSPEIELPIVDDNLFRFLPGRVQNWTGFGARINGRWQALPNSRDARAGELDLPAAVLLPSALETADTLELSTAGPTTLVAELIEPASGGVLSSSTSPAFEALVKPAYRHNLTSRRVAYRFRLADRLDYALGAPGDWFSETDVRSPALGAERFVIDQPQPGNFTNSAGITLTGPTGSFFDRAASTGPGVTSLAIKNDVVLYELPRQPPLSLGELQHVGFVGTRPFAIGNPWMAESGVSDDLFDRYFFSGTDATTPALGGQPQPFRNGRLQLYRAEGAPPPTLAELRGTPAARSSRHLLLAGPLNVNTADAGVWSSVLGQGDFARWRAVRTTDQWGAQNAVAGADTNEVALENAVFHFGQAAAETYDVAIDLAGYEVEEKSFYRRGVMTLTAAECDFLADVIVREVKSHLATSGPFRSVGEFVRAGVLATALDELASRGGSDLRHAVRLGLPAATDEQIDALSPSYLTAADLLHALAPLLTVRGDTFTVRTLGEALNPVTGETTAQAWLEAVVQRTPEYVDPDDAPEVDYSQATVVNQRFGRRFKILQVRWLDSPKP